MLTKENCGCSELACDIVNNTFLSLDGFAGMRLQMDATEYTAVQFAAELARVADRAIDEHNKKTFEAFALKFGVDTKTLRMTNHELAS